MSVSRRSASYSSLVRASSFQPQQYYSRNNNNSRAVYTAAQSSQQAQNAESNVERALLDARNPIQANGEQIVLNNQRVTVLNREENANFRGPIPLEQYQLNSDPNPVVIRKKPADKLRYRQNVTIRYLKPPTPKPSELVIVEEAPRPQPVAPPLVVRQERFRAVTPAPIVYREAPPPPPPPAERRVIYVRAPPQPQPCCQEVRYETSTSYQTLPVQYQQLSSQPSFQSFQPQSYFSSSFQTSAFPASSYLPSSFQSSNSCSSCQQQQSFF
jgi:hypothetical protein